VNRKFDRFIPSKWIFESEEFIEDNDNGENVDEYEDKNLENILFTEEFETASDQRRFLLSAMSMDEREILEMAESTVGQMDNRIYCILKSFRITASNFGSVLKAVKRNRYPPSLYTTLLSSYNLDNVSKKINDAI